jgi:hypothetical protein
VVARKIERIGQLVEQLRAEGHVIDDGTRHHLAALRSPVPATASRQLRDTPADIASDTGSMRKLSQGVA